MQRSLELLRRQTRLYLLLVIAVGAAMLFSLVPILSGIFISQVLIKRQTSMDGSLLMLLIALPLGLLMAAVLLVFIARQRRLARRLIQSSDLLQRLASGWLDHDPILAQMPPLLQRLWMRRTELGLQLLRVAEFLESYALYPRGRHPLAWHLRLGVALLATVALLVAYLSWSAQPTPNYRYFGYFLGLGAVNLLVFLTLGWACTRSYANCLELLRAYREMMK